MNYSASDIAKQARQALSSILQALQQDQNLPEDVASLTQSVAQTVSALYRAQTSANEKDGKNAIKEALELLSQTLIVSQATHSQHPRMNQAMEQIAQVMGLLYPLRQRSSLDPRLRPPALSPIKPRVVPGSPTQTGAQKNAAPAPAKPEIAIKLEVNLGAATESNFYVGFSSEINDGGVFIATYDTPPRGTPVDLLVTLPGGFEFSCRGRVRFVRDPMDFESETQPGVGVHFESLSAQARELVLRFIRKRPPMFYDVE